MKVTTEGLTLGIIKGLEKSGYKVEVDGDGTFANITKEAPLRASEAVVDGGGWGSLGEYL